MMKKRTLALLLVCAMLAAAFAGCTSGADDPATPGPETQSPSGPSAGSDAEMINIGGLAPLTGEVSLYGINVNNGVKIAVEEINAAGGLLGKQINYIVYDEKGDATEAVNAYNKLVSNDKIVALIGDVTSTPTLAVAQQAVLDNMPMITASGTAEDITAVGPNVFRACFIDPYQGELMASYSFNRLGAKKAAILYDTSSDYSVGLKDAFVAEAGRIGLEIVANEGYAGGDIDFKTQLTKIVSSGAEVLFLPEYYEAVALIAPQAREVGFTGALLGADGWDSVVESIDAGNLPSIEGSYFCAHASLKSTDPEFVSFVEKYQQKYGQMPNMFAALGYDAAMIMFDAIERAGSTDSDAIIAALVDTDYTGITGHVTFDENRNPVKSAAIMAIENGDYAFVETYSK
jgi:branched-chain amino acid transport system substrate-binding protein